jgi:hypothetical protein
MNNDLKNCDIKNILFLVEVPFTKRDFERFGIELLEKNGFNVIVWELTKIINPDLIKEYTPPDPVKLLKYKIFENKKLTLKKIRNIPSDTFVFLLVSYSQKNYWVYRALSLADADYGVTVSNALPMPQTKKEKSSITDFVKKVRKIPKKEIKKFIWRYFYKMPFSKLGIKPASLILAGGYKSLDTHFYPIDESTEILWTHTLDYDLYLKEKTNSENSRPIAVFIDEYVPFHPDYPVSGLKPPLDAETYYHLLDKFFNRIEKELGYEVTIAVNPRSNYEKHPDYFKGRKCIRGETNKLVKKSQVVIAHCSTALNYANLYKKPVIFITSKGLDESWYGPLIRTMSSWFGKVPIFIDNNDSIDWNSLMKIDNDFYSRYKQAYIKTEKSKNELFWQIVANRLKEW